MNQTVSYWLGASIAASIGISSLSFAVQPAQATTYARPTPTTVILPDWAGTWNCNLDGRPAVMQLWLANTRTCNGSICSITYGTRIDGRISDNSGPWRSLNQRNYTSGDLASSRRDHMLPVQFNNTDNWLLLMHTGNRNFISGYTTWNRIPFGFQCRR
jgi:hypothetical protein